MIANPSAVKKFLKTKIKSYGDEAIDLHDREVPKAGTSSNYTSLAVIFINFVLKKDENYSPQVLLKNISTLKKNKGD